MALLSNPIAARAESEPNEQESLVERDTFFEKRIRPVLVEQCFKCHSKGSKKTAGGLRLDSRQAMIRGGDSGPAIVAKNIEGSLLVQVVHYKPDEVQMPPKGKLPAKVHATILHLMGINHKRLTYRYSGRDFRLTDVHGEVVREIIA